MPSAYNVAKREVVDAGVDWLTCTVDGKKDFKLASYRASELLDYERARGNVLRQVTVQGYAGFACGQIFSGAYNGTLLTRLSGALASEHWKEFYALSSNVSRLDVQTTIRYTPHVGTVAHRAKRDVMAKIGESKSKLEVGIRSYRVRGDTCEIGRRVSDVFARIYDKHRESGRPEYLGCWRWELELKREVAKRVASALSSEVDERAAAASFVRSRFSKSGCTRLWREEARTHYSVCARRDSDATHTLRWFEKGVRPAVERLIEVVGVEAVVEALGLSDHVSINVEE